MYRFLLIVLLLSLPANLFAEQETSSLTKEEQKSLYEAQQAIERKDYQKARQTLLEHLKKYPDKPNLLVFYALGNAWHLDGNLNKAYEVYQKGYALYPSSFLLCANLGATAYELGKYLDAGDLFEKAYKLSNPSKADLLYQAGTAYYQAKDFKKADAVLSRLIKSGSETKSSWLQLFIHVSLHLEDWKKAEGVLQQLLNQNPKDVEYWRLLSQIQMRRNNYRGAAGALEIIYKIEHPASKDWEELANLYFMLNIPLKGARCLEKAYGTKPAPIQCEKLFNAYIQAQRSDKAIYYLDLAIQQERTSARLLEKGKLYYERGLWDDAIKALRESVRMGSENDFVLLLIGYCAMEKEDVALAREYLLKAAEGKQYRREAQSALDILEDM